MSFPIKQQKDTNVLYEVTSTLVLTDDYLVRGDGGVRGVQTSLVHLSDAGSVTLPNVQAYRFLDYAGTGYLNVLRGNINDEVDVGVKLNIGAIEAEEDAGRVALFDMPVSSSSADNTEMSAALRIDGNNIFEISALSDGSGGVDNKKARTYANIEPAVDDTYYLGEDTGTFRSFKGVILKDTVDGKHYKITVASGSLVATALD